jgi:hypothetical protein
MARTASQIGSLKSSPSTRTVKNAVIEPAEVAGPLADLRQQAEYGRRVALLAGRFARRQTDFPLRHGEARNRIHHEKDIFAAVAKILGDGERHEAGPDAQAARACRMSPRSRPSASFPPDPDRVRETRELRGCVRRSER